MMWRDGTPRRDSGTASGPTGAVQRLREDGLPLSRSSSRKELAQLEAALAQSEESARAGREEVTRLQEENARLLARLSGKTGDATNTQEPPAPQSYHASHHHPQRQPHLKARSISKFPKMFESLRGSRGSSSGGLMGLDSGHHTGRQGLGPLLAIIAVATLIILASLVRAGMLTHQAQGGPGCFLEKLGINIGQGCEAADPHSAHGGARRRGHDEGYTHSKHFRDLSAGDSSASVGGLRTVGGSGASRGGGAALGAAGATAAAVTGGGGKAAAAAAAATAAAVAAAAARDRHARGDPGRDQGVRQAATAAVATPSADLLLTAKTAATVAAVATTAAPAKSLPAPLSVEVGDLLADLSGNEFGGRGKSAAAAAAAAAREAAREALPEHRRLLLAAPRRLGATQRRAR